ncbi:TPR repeat-containing protein YrrB [Phycisphaerae bacterium RAS2]|nr:TPR repeat-containing protein YrrB [Phycisphaerae bacterium RAS2]
MIEAAKSDANIRRPQSIAVPCIIAFVASAAVMIVELLAFRLVARWFGNSIFATTSIIGVVLGGLAIGNYVGGLLADRYRAGRCLSALFVLASAACFAVPILNKYAGAWSALSTLTLPQRIASHVVFVFMLPALLLGAIGPVVARMALLRSNRVGRTVGVVYALGALGSIVGTFACGFFLIPQFGNYVVIQAVAAGMALMAISCAATHWPPYAWTGATAALLFLGQSSASWAVDLGDTLGLREKLTEGVLFDADSEYSHVRVQVDADHPTRRRMILDKLCHSVMDSKNPHALQYGYERVYAAVADCVTKPGQPIRVLILGGGGYTHPRHILHMRPGSYVEVVEIDPVVTRAARETFGLAPQQGLEIVHLDARQHLTDLVRRRAAGEAIPLFDFVYLDAINDFSVPFHLMTQECHQLIAELMSDSAVYMINMVDIYAEGRLLGSSIRTLRRTFPFVEGFFASFEGDRLHHFDRYTFVLAASRRDMQLDRLKDSPTSRAIAKQQLTPAQFDTLLARCNPLVLVDDHAPMEFLLMNVVQSSRKAGWNEDARKAYSQGNAEFEQNRVPQAVEYYREAIRLDPTMYLAHLNLGLAYIELGQYDRANEAFRAAIDIQPNRADPFVNLGGLSMRTHDYDAACRHYEEAIAREPKDAHAHNGLGMALANLGRLTEARAAIQRAIELQPDYPAAVRNLAQVDAAIASRSSGRGTATAPAGD